MANVVFNLLPIEIAIVSNAIILDVGEADTDEADGMNNARIAYDNALSRATIIASNDQAGTVNLFDHMTTSFWNASNGTVTLDITLPSNEAFDCAAVAAANWADSNTTIEIYTDAGVTKVGEVSGLKNGQPYYFEFEPVSTNVMQIKFISTGDLNVGQVLMGESLKFPVKSSVGLQLGKFNNKDKAIGQMTENNGFGANSTVKRSRDTISPFNLLPISWVNSDWVAFSDAFRGKPIWFSWDSVNNPADTTYGHWSTDPVKYTSSFLSSLTLTVKGQV